MLDIIKYILDFTYEKMITEVEMNVSGFKEVK